jgi:hypothetical protein
VFIVPKVSNTWSQKEIIERLKVHTKPPKPTFVSLSEAADICQKHGSSIRYAITVGGIPLNKCYAYKASKVTKTKLFVNLATVKRYYSVAPIEQEEDTTQEETGDLVFDENGIAIQPVFDLTSAKYRNEILKIKRQQVALRHDNNQSIDRELVSKVAIALGIDLKGFIDRYIIEVAPKLSATKTLSERREVLRTVFNDLVKEKVTNISSEFMENFASIKEN